MNAKSPWATCSRRSPSEIIARLIQIAIQQVLIKPLLDALGGGGGFGGGGGGGGFFSAVERRAFQPACSPMARLIPNGGFSIVRRAGPEPVFAALPAESACCPTARAASSRWQWEKAPPGYLHVSVSGARGNAEIEEMVRSGVSQGIASYDRVIGRGRRRVQDQLARRS